MGRIAIAVALLTTAALAQTYPSSHAPHAPAATAFLALPAVAPGQAVPRSDLNRPTAAPAGELAVFRMGSSLQPPGCVAVDKAAKRVVFFQAQPPDVKGSVPFYPQRRGLGRGAEGGVVCASCHDKLTEHLRDTRHKPGQRACDCHTPEHSPRFHAARDGALARAVWRAMRAGARGYRPPPRSRSMNPSGSASRSR